MRIYDGDFTVSRIIEDCSKPMPDHGFSIDGRKQKLEIDIDKLNDRLAYLPCEEIRMRRARMNRFFEEMLNGADPDRGIHFTSLLITLAHYKVINDNKSLRYVNSANIVYGPILTLLPDLRSSCAARPDFSASKSRCSARSS